jgi:hypothetical protein
MYSEDDLDALERVDGITEIVDEWNGYKEGDSMSVGGAQYQIVRIEIHHESDCAFAVLAKTYDRRLYTIDIPYERTDVDGNR